METYSKHCEGYPTFIVWEGEAYCTSCANEFANDEIEDEDLDEDDKIFSVPEHAGISQHINWENKNLWCSSMHGCSERIEAAYE